MGLLVVAVAKCAAEKTLQDGKETSWYYTIGYSTTDEPLQARIISFVVDCVMLDFELDFEFIEVTFVGLWL